MGPPFIFFFYFGVFGDLILGAVKRHNLRRRATLLPTFVLRSGSLCVTYQKVGCGATTKGLKSVLRAECAVRGSKIGGGAALGGGPSTKGR